MQSELQQLRQLVFAGGFDQESKRQVEEYEKRLRELAVNEKVAELPAIKEFLAYMEAEIARAELLLKADETLDDVQRAKLFAIIKVSEKYTHLFNGNARRSLEQDIKNALDVARS